ncbi:MAG: hypothetical protein KIT87_23570 [Anaerolineae bacterium]|nr:hypothetical protein [Anaerolineae bacterium]
MTDTSLELEQLPIPAVHSALRRPALYTWLSRLTPSIWLSGLLVPVVYFCIYAVLLMSRTGASNVLQALDPTAVSGMSMVTVEILLFILIERGAEKLLRHIRPALLLDEGGYTRLRWRCLNVSRRWDWTTLLMAALGPLGYNSYAVAASDPILRVYYLGGITLVALWLWQLIGAMARSIWINNHLQHQPLAIDIFDSDDLVPLAKFGLLISLPGPTIVTLMTLFWGFVPTGMTLFIYGVLLGTSALGFFLPLRGLHHRMVRAKARELEAVQTRVRQAYERLNQSAPHEEAGRAQTLAYLLAAEARVQAAATWPFDMGILGQLAATLLIPLAIACLQFWLSRLG